MNSGINYPIIKQCSGLFPDAQSMSRFCQESATMDFQAQFSYNLLKAF